MHPLSRIVVATTSLVAFACTNEGSSESSSGDSSASDSSSSDSSSSASGTADDDGSTGAAATGTVTLSFGVSNGVRMGPTLVDPLVGSVYGDLYLTSEVTITGPTEDAVAFASIVLDEVDLSTLDVSAVSWTSEPLPAGDYTFLGMFDLDGNFEQTDEGPDPGDPVTLPTQAFDIVEGQDTAFTVIFDLVFG